MAVRTDFNGELVFGRRGSHGKRIAAGAAYLDLMVGRVNVFSHNEPHYTQETEKRQHRAVSPCRADKNRPWVGHAMLKKRHWVSYDIFLADKPFRGVLGTLARVSAFWYAVGMNEAVLGQGTVAVPAVPFDPEIEEMMHAGVHLGHAKSKTSPAMVPYIFGVRNTVAILDLIKTKQKLESALTLLQAIAARGGMILFVGTRPVGRMLIPEMAGELGMPYLAERWIGGTLTNFKVIGKRVEYLETLERDRASGVFEKYTKRERTRKDEEIVRLKRFFDGLRTLKRMPDAVFIVDTNHDDTAVREARKMRIPVIALADTNTNITLIDHPIPANDDALPAVRYMLGRVAGAVREGLRMQADRKADEKKEVVAGK